LVTNRFRTGRLRLRAAAGRVSGVIPIEWLRPIFSDAFSGAGLVKQVRQSRGD